jgi:hypothetical protein
MDGKPPQKFVFKELHRGQLVGAAKKVGRLCVHVRILFVCLPFCQRISSSRQKPRFS